MRKSAKADLPWFARPKKKAGRTPQGDGRIEVFAASVSKLSLVGICFDRGNSHRPLDLFSGAVGKRIAVDRDGWLAAANSGVAYAEKHDRQLIQPWCGTTGLRWKPGPHR